MSTLLNLVYLGAATLVCYGFTATVPPLMDLTMPDRIPSSTRILSVDKTNSKIPAYCNGSDVWLGAEHAQVIRNCRDADATMSREWQYGLDQFEFLSWGARSAHPELPILRTPYKFTYGKLCQ